MPKSLIIAEKPSVAADIARALGGFTRHDDYYESDKHVLSSAVGHLLELGMPEAEEVKRGKWTFAHLPAIPSKFELRPIEKNENRLKVLLRLIKRKDVSQLINACDAGREGELIFRNVVQYAKASKPIRRLWLQSMTPAAIRDAFGALRTDEAMLPLADAAVCRSESDWLVGINGTRAMTAFNSKAGGFQLTTVGRVQTPTLAILVEREEKIGRFEPRDYWEVVGTFRAAGGEYTGRWFDETFKRKDDDPDLRAERLWSESAARALAAKCAGKPGIVTEESKPSTQIAPLLYDLTSLQREANGRFGFSARTTLSLAQALYEKHKALTYPRTDSRALPEDYLQTVSATMEALTDSNAYGGFAREILKRKWVKPSRRIFDNAKVSDHFAIIPTLVRPKHLSEIEAKLYDLVVKRFLAVFYPAAEYLVTTRITRVESEPFKSEGKVLVSAGWLAVYGREALGDEPTLAPIKPSERVATEKIDVVALTTRPPPRFTEATLLSAMEGAGKLIEDEELREAMREKGLGTPATRAQIIEGLIYERYILREGKELIPTPKAFSLMTLLHGLGVPELFAPELTAEWEFKLAQMEHGKLPRRDFMREIIKMTRHIVAQAKNYESDTIPGDFATLSTPCPKCGGEVHEKYRKFQCMNPACDFAFWKIMGGRQLSPPEAEILLRERRIGPLDGFRSRLGRPFTAELKLNDANEVEFDFGERAIVGDDGEAPDFSQLTPLGPCPKCGHRVFEVGNVYVCERAIGTDRSCDFRSGRTILQRPIDPAQMQKLLTTGKTDLLQFVSSRTRRPFSAYLVRQKDGSVGFEFEPRDPSKKGRPQRGGASPVRVLGMHPRDKHPVELHAGRYGPYIKHRDINATLPDKDTMDSVTLAEAVALVDAKAGRPAKPAARTSTKERRAKPSARQNGEQTTAPAARVSAVAARAKPNPRATSRSKTAKQSQAKRPRPAAAPTAAKRRSAK
ncbi:MAG TPA: DNA topoisomerase III [Casimicrobiaceae bacterium]|nr:DNA topoisomerase III [Casimicrobiaceae bacterium]